MASFLSPISSALGTSPVGCSLKTSAVSSEVRGVLPLLLLLSTPTPGSEPVPPEIPPPAAAAAAAGAELLSVEIAVLSKLDMVPRRRGENR